MGKQHHERVTGKGKRHQSTHKLSGRANLRRAQIRRLASRAGVKRIGGDAIEECQEIFYKFCEELLAKTTTITQYRKRKKIKVKDVTHALKLMNKPIYGVDS